MANSRKTAFKVLLKIEQDGAYSNIALNNAVKESELSPLDAAFTSALVYGVLERKITLDYIIKQKLFSASDFCKWLLWIKFPKVPLLTKV